MRAILAKHIYIPVLLAVVLTVTGCGGGQTLRGVLQKETPYQRYTSSITSANLHQTALGRLWLEAGQKALKDSISVSLPFKETGYFAADMPRAIAYRFNARRGEKITIAMETTGRENMQVFMDLFEQLNSLPDLVAFADSSTNTILYEVENDGTHLLRLQPEPLRSGQYTLTITAAPTLAFPVVNRSSRNISSVWGDARDQGARLHEGVDIFAPRGTPVLASAAGIVRGVSTTPRGGKVIWLLDTDRRQSLYYAHLDSQLVVTGQQVQAGDTIGLVGNTGNASSTAPHLHFGIYRFGKGATNPYPYLHQPSETPPSIKGNVSDLGNWRRVSARLATIRLAPASKGKAAATVKKNTPLQVLSLTDNWYRISLPDGTEGYIAGSVTEGTAKPIQQNKLAEAVALLDGAAAMAAAKDSIPAGENISVLANYKSYKLVQLQNGKTGWISAP